MRDRAKREDAKETQRFAKKTEHAVFENLLTSEPGRLGRNLFGLLICAIRVICGPKPAPIRDIRG